MKAMHIRPSTTRSSAALWIKSGLNAVGFFAVFLALLPWLAARALPLMLPLHGLTSRLLGCLLFTAGIVIWLWCLDPFSRQGRGTPFPLDAPRHLVTSGPFAVIRNPIMAAEIGILWAEVLYFGRLGLLLYAVLVTITGHIVVTRIEEPELRQRMGAAYEDYCRRVPRWFPKRLSGGAGGSRPTRGTAP